MSRPLVFFDLETTGLDVQNDRIVQFAFLKIHPDLREEEWVELVNPEVQIPKEASDVHHITIEMVQDMPTMAHFAPKIQSYLKGCDLAGFNVVRFDVPFLQAEMTRRDCPLELEEVRIVDAQVIFHKKEPRNLTAAYRIYCNKDLEGAHDALADIKATRDVLEAQLRKYSDIPKEIQGLNKFCKISNGRFVTQDRKFYWRNGEAVLAFGRNKNKSLKWLCENNRDYLMWMLNGDFSNETRQVIENALQGTFPSKGADSNSDTS